MARKKAKKSPKKARRKAKKGGKAPRARKKRAAPKAISAYNGDLTVNELESWLWAAACEIRGAMDAPKFKDYILPLIFLKRLSDVFDEEIDRLAKDFGDRETALDMAKEDRVVDERFVCRAGGIMGDRESRFTREFRGSDA